MTKRIGMLVAAVALLVSVTGCEPKMTITAKDADHSTTCGYVMHVVGNVKPVGSTPKVVVQQTSGGKWVDVKGWASSDSYWSSDAATARTANVSKSTGGYSVAYFVDWFGTKHLRVRSAGGGSFSPGFYVKVDGEDGC